MKIPGFRNPEEAAAFDAVVASVAEKTGMSSYAVVTVLTYAVEAAVDVVSRGGVLRMPGLGVIAAWKDERRSVVAKFGKPIMTPRFSPSRGFRAQVALCCPLSSKGKQAITRHRQNHSSGVASGECSARVSSAAHSIRESIKAQMGGLDPVRDLDP